MRDLGDSGAPSVLPQAGMSPSAPTRRSLLRGAAGAGAAGLAVTALGGLALPAAASAATPAARNKATETRDERRDGAQTAQAVVVHVRNAATGEIDIFRGTTQTRLHDRELAARLVRASS